MKHKYTFIFLLLFAIKVYSQKDFFNDMMVNKTLHSKNEKFVYTIRPEFKSIYNDNSWYRFSLLGEIKRPFQMWSFGFRLGIYYSIDKKYHNSFELRPAFFIGLKTPILSDLTFSQTIRGELRNFLYSDSDLNFTTNRVRYNINMVYNFRYRKERANFWSLRPEIEWYLLKNENQKDRFVSSTEYTMTLLYTFKKTKQVGVGFRIEHFNNNFYTNNDNGNSLTFEYNF